MIYLVAFVVACLVMPWLVALRRMMAVEFAVMRIDMVDVPPPPGTADAFAAATATLAALGFSGPHWFVLLREDGRDATLGPRALYLHATDDTHVVLWPTLDPDRNGPLMAVVATRFVDGTTAITSAFDATVTLIPHPELRSRVVAEHDLAALLRDHAAWNATAGVEVAPAISLDASLARERQRSAAWLAAGLAHGLHRDADGILRARLPFAWRMLRMIRQMPRAKVPQPILPAPHLAEVARVVEANNERAPPRQVQLGFFATSVVASLAFGAWAWNVTFAVILLVVILVHELGHFLAMRAFGYRDVHMLALPLVGGVTMGHDADPQAHRQAWMSLMGPLPGIVIGWLLLGWHFGVVADGAPSWAIGAAIAFLAINYFNLLPMAALDGAHVVTAMLPPRQVWWRGVAFFALAIAGVVLGFAIEAWVIVAFAVVVAFGGRGAFALARAARRIDVSPSAWRAMPATARTEAALAAFDASEGPARANMPRVGQAIALRQLFDTRPMSAAQRITIGTVYLGVIAAPVVLVASFVGIAWPGADDDDTAARAAAYHARHDAADAHWRGQADAIARSELFDALCDGVTRGADAAAIDAAQARLGTRFDAGLTALYRRCDGALHAGVVPLAQLARHDAIEADLVAGLMPVEPGDVAIDAMPDARTSETTRVATVPRATVASWLVIADPGEMEALVHLVPPDGSPASLAGHVVECSYACVDRGPFDAWLRETWIAAKVSADLVRAYEARLAQARATLADADVATLVAAAEARRHGGSLAALLQRLRGAIGGASEDEIAATEARIGRALPAELREVYAIRDGIASWRLGPVAGITPMRDEDVPAAPIPIHVTGDDESTPPKPIPADTLRRCLRLGDAPAIEWGDAAETRAYVRASRLLWCPDAPDAGHRIVDLQLGRGYPTVRAWLVDMAARRRTMRLG